MSNTDNDKGQVSRQYRRIAMRAIEEVNSLKAENEKLRKENDTLKGKLSSAENKLTEYKIYPNNK